MSSKPPPIPHSASTPADAFPADETLSAEVPQQAIPEPDEIDGQEDELWEEEDIEPTGLSRLLYGFGSCGFSLVFHLVGLLVLAYLTVPDTTKEVTRLVQAAFAPPDETLPVEVELEETLQTATDRSLAVFGADPMANIVEGLEGVEEPAELDTEIFKQSADDSSFDDIQIDDPLANAPSFERLVEAVPDGEFKGDPRAVIDDYQQAIDRIAQELMWMMDKGPVLVIWAFDQSGSMKDDQREIRDRINHVYVQLGLVGRDSGDWLETSVVSYGEGYRLHTRRPTSDIGEIRAAIEAVPQDPSGKEMMCQSVIRAVQQHQDYARTHGRQTALVLVTDESGEQDDNRAYLEQAVMTAKSASCRIYVLGRESVFGYPYAYMRWRHPQTHRMHWLRVNRGPETGFVEQLQVDGFRRRHDAFPSGFGPYEQCRLARETGGIFFMLPSLETSLVRGEKRRYELEIMRPYRPDLRARGEVIQDRDRYPLRAVIWQCIYDLDPYQRPEVAKQIEMRVQFSPNYEEFVRQARQEQTKARNYLVYLARVQQVLEAGVQYRKDEADPRWRANYDLIYAQLVAYQARIWEYGASLEAFIKTPKVVPLTKPPNLRLLHWDVHVRRETLTEESKPYIEQAKGLFQQVVDTYPGTPWAARAADELKRGFGVDFRPDYHPPYYDPPGGATPPPKL